MGERKILPLVPKDALVLNGNDRIGIRGRNRQNDRHYLRATNGIVRKVTVDLGVAVNRTIQVMGEVKTDDLVVVEGNERLVPDTKVKIVSFQDPTSKN